MTPHRHLAVVSAVLLSISLLSGAASALPAPWVQEAHTFGTKVNDGNSVGRAIDIEGDLMVLGAAGQFGGDVYVFGRNHGGTNAWGLIKAIPSPTEPATDLFGQAVALSGETLVIGAPAAGKVYVHERNLGGADNWGLSKELEKDFPAPLDIQMSSDSFGSSVALDGDTLLVGALSDAVAPVFTMPDSGRVFVLERNQGGAGNWGFVQELVTGEDLLRPRWFGYGLALDGDTAVVGQRFTADPGISAGTAFIFERNQGGADAWGLVTPLVSSGANFRDDFGSAVAIDGDTAVVGAPQDGASPRPGAAYTFERSLGWAEADALGSPEAGLQEQFGFSIGISGDVLAISAPQDVTGMEQGAIYMFERNADGTTWTEVQRITVAEDPLRRQLGVDIDLDGTALAAAIFENFGVTTVPAAYVFRQLLPLPVPALDTLGLAALALLLAGAAVWRVRRAA